MKKLFTVLAVAVAAVFSANAEDFYVGGSLGFEHNAKRGEYQTNTFNIMPEIGYNINDHWAVGTTIGYEYRHTCGYDINMNMFNFSPYARFTYFRTNNSLVQLFIDGGAGIGLGWESSDGDGHTAVTWNVGLTPGVAFNITNKFAIVAHLGFIGYKGANNAAYNGGAERRGGFFVNGTDLNLGFYYKF